MRRIGTTGSLKEASANYKHAIAVTGNDSERRSLERRLKEVTAGRNNGN